MLSVEQKNRGTGGRDRSAAGAVHREGAAAGGRTEPGQSGDDRIDREHQGRQRPAARRDEKECRLPGVHFVLHNHHVIRCALPRLVPVADGQVLRFERKSLFFQILKQIQIVAERLLLMIKTKISVGFPIVTIPDYCNFVV